jgi:hypothetical protein
MAGVVRRAREAVMSRLKGVASVLKTVGMRLSVEPEGHVHA